MTQLKFNQSQQRILIIALLLSLGISAWFLQHYIMLILLSAVVVVLFNPVYEWLLRHGRKPGTAATLTFFASLLAVIIPLIFVCAITIVQVQSLIHNISSDNYSQDINQLINNVIDYVNQWAAKLGLSYRLSMDSITNSILAGLQNFGSTLINGLFSSISSIFGLITTSIIYLYVFLAMIVKQDKIMTTIKQLNPLGDEMSNLYIGRISAMTKATIRGQFIIAFCQGLASAAVLTLAGLHGLFFFFLLTLTVLSIVPLGAGIVTIPIGIIMILTGNVVGGVAVIANHLLIVTNIDNVLRPILVPREARLNSALMILAVFAGLGMFGFFGIVLGPVLMIILVTTLQVYLQVFKEEPMIVEQSPPKKHLVARLRSVFAK